MGGGIGGGGPADDRMGGCRISQAGPDQQARRHAGITALDRHQPGTTRLRAGRLGSENRPGVLGEGRAGQGGRQGAPDQSRADGARDPMVRSRKSR